MGHLSEAALVAKFCSDTDLRLGNCRLPPSCNRVVGRGFDSPSRLIPQPSPPAAVPLPTCEVVLVEFKASLETVSLWSLTSEAEAAAAVVSTRGGLGTLR